MMLYSRYENGAMKTTNAIYFFKESAITHFPLFFFRKRTLEN